MVANTRYSQPCTSRANLNRVWFLQAFLFFQFLMFDAFAALFAKFYQIQFALHRFRFVSIVIDIFADRALQFHVWFLFCCHNFINSKREARILETIF